jgi:hypothetical protein
MTTINFDQLFQDLKTGAITLAKTSLDSYVEQAKADGQAALDAMKTNLSHWTQEVENGAMTIDDLEFLLQEEAALDEMTALKQAGLAEVRIDQYKNALINLVLGTVTGLIKI